ncbi:MAG: hypothetical protein R3C68_01905 [Myxococcota bacterium]
MKIDTTPTGSYKDITVEVTWRIITSQRFGVSDRPHKLFSMGEFTDDDR